MSQSARLRAVQFGKFHDSIPVPHEPDDTTMFPAADLTVGLEYRVFDPVAEAAKLTADEVAAAGEDSLFHRDDIDEGVCIHVFATEGMREVLRFDCFAAEPHYHYIVPDEGNVLVHFDRHANGSMFRWAVAQLRDNIDDMLDLVGEPGVTAVADPQAWTRALDAVVARADELGVADL